MLSRYSQNSWRCWFVGFLHRCNNLICYKLWCENLNSSLWTTILFAVWDLWRAAFREGAHQTCLCPGCSLDSPRAGCQHFLSESFWIHVLCCSMWQCCQQYNCHLQCLTFARSEEWCSKNTIFLSQKYRECWKCLWLWTFIIAYPISRFISARGPPSMWRVTLFYLIAFCQVVMEEKLFHQNCLIKCRAVLVDPVCISVFLLRVFRWRV